MGMVGFFGDVVVVVGVVVVVVVVVVVAVVVLVDVGNVVVVVVVVVVGVLDAVGTNETGRYRSDARNWSSNLIVNGTASVRARAT